MSHRPGPVNVVAIDQENRGIVAVVNSGPTTPMTPSTFAAQLPSGGGIVVGDANVWSVRTPFSVSQYCWSTQADLDEFVEALAAAGYQAVVVANKFANNLIAKHKVVQAEAVRALCAEVHDQLERSARAVQTAPAGSGLPCGCAAHGTFDGGHVLRPSRGDRSFGQREVVSRSFLRLQNTGGYQSPFAEDIIQLAWEHLDGEGREVFGMLKTRPECKVPSKLMAIAVCTHYPGTGELRMRDGQPWGLNFIVRHVIALNGNMSGTGARTAGNPMRAVLRVRGIRAPGRRLPVDKAARARLDLYVRELIRVFQEHGPVRPAGGDWPTADLAPVTCAECGHQALRIPA